MRWSFPDLLLRTMSGILYILTFGLTSSCQIEKMLGKTVWSTLSIGISIALLKTDKPAPMELSQTIPICLSILCQVITRIFIFCNLTLVESVTPLIIFTSLHFIFVFIIKIMNTTKEKCSTIKDLFRIFISGVCSLVVLTHLESGETFFSQSAFFILIAIENLVMMLLPVIFPSIYPEYICFPYQSQINGIFCVLVLWIFGIVFQILHYKFAHQWSDLNGVSGISRVKGNGVNGISRVKGWFGCSSNSSKDKSADMEGKREKENRNQNERYETLPLLNLESNISTQSTGLEDVGRCGIDRC
ncbi:uncharacterized protein LOC111715212 [Eurytemora carolleeae]|uniref:uncharacterized protein LOC111715212 n=1 Tax=Eurytemora carolleeae TaxID=1294199 RepID=UPI000C76DDAB|nr:uncharacterized protein LOC111715212 [Eurytemora carolleeae]|eukprot:XP_023346283.1 uncharacterized protein LOC111715212 [Eurytemora affinis]